MKEWIIDFSQYPNIDAFHEDIAAKLDFPAHYGKNLDALNDMMGELPSDAHAFTFFYGGTGIPHKQQVLIAKILLRKV